MNTLKLVAFILVAQNAFAQTKVFDVCRDTPNDIYSAWWFPEHPEIPGDIRMVEKRPMDGDYGMFMGTALIARDEVKAWFTSGKLQYRVVNPPDWDRLPNIKWFSFDFWVPLGSWYDDQGVYHEGGVCAAGMADYQYNQIVISYRLKSRVAPLVEWEVINYYLCKAGRTDWADRWTSLVPDQSYVPPPPKRRSAHH
jgi:hypothetical protein